MKQILVPWKGPRIKQSPWPIRGNRILWDGVPNPNFFNTLKNPNTDFLIASRTLELLLTTLPIMALKSNYKAKEYHGIGPMLNAFIIFREMDALSHLDQFYQTIKSSLSKAERLLLEASFFGTRKSTDQALIDAYVETLVSNIAKHPNGTNIIIVMEHMVEPLHHKLKQSYNVELA